MRFPDSLNEVEDMEKLRRTSKILYQVRCDSPEEVKYKRKQRHEGELDGETWHKINNNNNLRVLEICACVSTNKKLLTLFSQK